MMAQEKKREEGKTGYIGNNPDASTIAKTAFEKEDYSPYLKILIKDMYSLSLDGKRIKNNDLIVFLGRVLAYKVGNSSQANSLKAELIHILQGNGSTDAMEKATDFICKLSCLGLGDEVCNIFLKQFKYFFLLNEYDNATSAGKYLEDDEIEFIFNMIPGISAEVRKDLYGKYKSDVAKVVGLKFVKPEDILIINELKNLRVDKKISDIISKQIELSRYGSRDYYKNKQIFDMEGIKALLNKIQGVNPETIDGLCVEYEHIINDKNRLGAAYFICKLSSIGADKTICDIIQTNFNEKEIGLTAEVMPLQKGNLIVPEKTDKNTKLFKQRYECGGEFVGKRNFENSSKKYILPSSLTEELVKYFEREVIQPFEDCKEQLPSYIEQKLKDKETFFETKLKLKHMQGVLFNKGIEASFRESLEFVKKVSEELVSEEKDIVDLIGRLKDVLPSYYAFETIKECVAELYKLKGRQSEAYSNRNIFKRANFYDFCDEQEFRSILMNLMKALLLCKEELFPHDPCLADIKQEYIGDCYLLAAIASVLNSYGPNFIRNMMVDNGDGTVTVRLYAQSKEEFKKSECHVKYVKVYKHGLMGNQRSALWVQIIEKAYISLGANVYEGRHFDKIRGINENYESYKNSYPWAVEDLDGGLPSYAFIVLTGIKGRYFNFKNHKEEKVKMFRQYISQKRPFACAFEDKFSYNNYELIGKHGYSIIELKEEDGKEIVRLSNPYDADEPIFLPIDILLDHIMECYTIIKAKI